MENSKLLRTEKVAANMIEQLPQEIILGILSTLPVTSLLQSMLVCRTWRGLIQDQLLVSKHFSHMAEKGPSFIFQSNRPESSYQLYFVDFTDDSEGKVILKKLPDSPMPMHLVDSCNGLLCMRVSRGIYVYNPFTRLYLELPKLVKYPTEVGHIEFGIDQTKNEYKVVQIAYGRLLNRSSGPQSPVQVLTIGDPAWRDLRMIPYGFTRPTSKAMVNGRLHWLSKPNKYTAASLVLSFDLATEQFQEVPKPDCCGLDRCFHNLMVLRGCLSAVAYHDSNQLEIWVMKEYGVKESWIKEFTIGFYLPRTLQRHDISRYKIAMIHFPNSYVRVLCILRNGEILLEFRNRALVLYDSQRETFKEITFQEMPHWFKVVHHVGCLNWIDTPIHL